MDTATLEKNAHKLCLPGKGLLAADESNATCQKRFDAVGVECTEESRRIYRQLLVATPGVERYLNGVIFYDETFWQKTDQGHPFREYLKDHDELPGIKVDKGLVDFPGFEGEKITIGLDDLPQRIQKYADAGAKFAKWRAVITIGENTPSYECIGANAFVLARYARICQDAGVVPIVEPEVLYDGSHTEQECEEAIAETLDTLFQTMETFRVYLPGTILKTSMVLPGKDSKILMDHDDVAKRTCRVLHEHVPKELGGVVFLSGGQAPSEAFINLNRIAKLGGHPWGITYSYSRALQDQALKTWAANQQMIDHVQSVYMRQLTFAAAASKGELNESELGGDAFVSGSQDL
jgi:fructose-bisphosphate aldolase class I